MDGRRAGRTHSRGGRSADPRLTAGVNSDAHSSFGLLVDGRQRWNARAHLAPGLRVHACDNAHIDAVRPRMVWTMSGHESCEAVYSEPGDDPEDQRLVMKIQVGGRLCITGLRHAPSLATPGRPPPGRHALAVLPR